VAREDFGMVAGPPPKRQAGEDTSGMRAWGELEDWGSKGKGKDKGWGKGSWRDSWDDRGDYYDDMDGYGKGKGWGKDSGKKGWGKDKGKGSKGYGYGGGKDKGKNNGYSNSAPYSMHDERGDDDRGYTRERSPRRGSAGSFGGRWKHDMFGEKGDSLDEFRNFGGREPRKGKGKGGKGKSKNGKNGKPADPKQLDQELSKYFGKEADGLEKETLDGELESYMGKEKVTKEKPETDAKEKPAETEK